MKQQMPELFRAEPDLMLKLVTMLSPTLLIANGVPVHRCHQVRPIASAIAEAAPMLKLFGMTVPGRLHYHLP
jgi:predicted methyltransferase